MPIYKMDGKKDGLQKYRVRINYTDNLGVQKQLDRVAYGKDAAKELESRLMRDLKEETGNKITVADLCDEYIRVKRNEIRESTLDKQVKHLNKYVIPFFNSTRLSKLTVPQLQRWKTYIEELQTTKQAPLSLSYKQKLFSSFRSVLNYAVKMEYIDKAHCPSWEISRMLTPSSMIWIFIRQMSF